MAIRKRTKTSLVVTIGLIVLVVNKFSTNSEDYDTPFRNMSSREPSGVINRMGSYSSPGSIAAVINTAKMGTGSLHDTFLSSWKCLGAPPVQYMAVHQCEDDRRVTRTLRFSSGYSDIKRHRKEHPEGKCLVTTALRSPATWFGSMYLQVAKQNWRPTEEMLQDYRNFLAAGDFHMLYNSLPDLLKEFNAGTLIQQAKIMDNNGGYSLIPAPKKSVLAGCDLLFLRMEQSDRWPDIFKMLDPDIKPKRGRSRLQDHPDNTDQINAIAAYQLTSEEKINIYNNQDKFVQEWFDSYGYMDDVIDSENKDRKVSNAKVTAVINTPKMGTGGLFLTVTENRRCQDSESPVKGLVVLDCKNDHKAIRSHKFDVGVKALQEQRKENPESQCLIVTAIRSPETWFASKFLETMGGCRTDEWPTKEQLLARFKKFILARTSYQTLYGAIPDLLNEFGGGSLKEQSEIMDANGGYSMLGPAPQGSSVAGCNLLFLRMEESDQWPTILKQVDATIEFRRGAARVDQCPEFTEHIKVVADYEMTMLEKKIIYERGGAFVKEWFDSYGYMNDVVEKDIAFA